MKIKKIIFFVLIFGFFVFSALFYFGPFQLRNPSYLLWVLSGNECSQEYLENYVFRDYGNNSLIISGLNEEQIRKRFPGMFDADSFSKDSNRGQILTALRNGDYKNRNLRMLWFDNEHDWGWAILLLDGKGEKFELFKP